MKVVKLGSCFTWNNFIIFFKIYLLFHVEHYHLIICFKFPFLEITFNNPEDFVWDEFQANPHIRMIL